MIERGRPATIDAGGMIALERGDGRIRAYLELLAGRGVPAYVPTPAVAEVWRSGSGRQALLARWLRVGIARGHIRLVGLDLETAKEVGLLLGRAPMSITDGLVCHTALKYRTTVITSDPQDIAKVVAERLIVTV